MYVNRDFFDVLKAFSQLEVVMLWGPRQVGKTTLLDHLNLQSEMFLDDLSVRTQAQEDPGFFLDSVRYPCLIDEAQYAPNLFPEIKLRIDRLRRERLKKNISSAPPQTLFYLTGSNRTLLNDQVQESLAGRSHLFQLQGLSVKEILQHRSDTDLKSILFRGGLPELYVREQLSPVQYLNDYISSFVEKDVARTSGVRKIHEFQTVLKVLAARTGQFIQSSEISGVSGIEQPTVQAWASLLRQNGLLELIPTYSSNLSKRITKMKKLFFIDTGLCARLQGHLSAETLWNSPQAGGLFETLVFAEILKTKTNFLKDWQIWTWRTKEKNEIDFVLQAQDKFILLEAKMGIHGAKPLILDVEAQKVFPENAKKVVVTAGGTLGNLGHDTTRVPIAQLGEFLLSAI